MLKQENPGLKLLLRQLQFALALTTLVPLLAISYLILRYVSPMVLARESVAALLVAILVLMLTGTRMVFSLIIKAGKAAISGVPSGRNEQFLAIQKKLCREGRSIRHTVAEATALIGAIPLLALGYVVVRYVLPVHTAENILLLIVIIAVILLLGIQQIQQLMKRILTVAVSAKLVSMEEGLPKEDYGLDEISELSTDLGTIATKLSARSSELEETRSFLSHLIDRLPHPLIVVSSTGSISLANPAAIKLLEYEPLELIGLRASSLFPVQKDAEKLLSSGEDSSMETALRKKDGTRVPVSICSGALSQSGCERGTVLVGTDLTERRRLEDDLRHAQKMEAIGLLAGGIAHDFNNILTIIKGCGYFLEQGLTRDDPRRLDLDHLQKAVDRASSLTYQLLAFSRKQTLKPLVININSVILGMDRLLRRLLGEDIEISTVLATDLGNLKADMGQMEQIIINLAINARDAMPAGGRLTIESANTVLDELYVRDHPDVRSGPYIMISVTDSGCGMSKDVKARIFEPFFTTKEVDKGSGMGLSTVYGIVKQHGGHIFVYSEEGNGTTFRIYLPRVRGEVTPIAAKREKSEAPGGTETVLLVEDDESILDTSRRALAAHGYTVLAARNGEEALDISGQHEGRIDLLVTDVIMPVMGGRELDKKLRETRGGVKTIFTSGYTGGSLAHHNILDGDILFIQKPYAVEKLLRKIREVLDKEQ